MNSTEELDQLKSSLKPGAKFISPYSKKIFEVTKESIIERDMITNCNHVNDQGVIINTKSYPYLKYQGRIATLITDKIVNNTCDLF